MAKGEEIQRFGVSFESDLIAEFDKEIAAAGYSCRSEALRDLARLWIAERRLRRGEGEIGAALAFIYSHEQRDVTRRLNQLGHQFYQEVVTSIHIHLDEERCLEVLILRGRAQEIQRLADRLSAIKGVEQGRVCLIGLPAGGAYEYGAQKRNKSRSAGAGQARKCKGRSNR